MWFTCYMVGLGATTIAWPMTNPHQNRPVCTCPAATADHNCPMHHGGQSAQTCALENANPSLPVALWPIQGSGVMPRARVLVAALVLQEPLAIPGCVAPLSRSDAPDAPPPRA